MLPKLIFNVRGTLGTEYHFPLKRLFYKDKLLGREFLVARCMWHAHDDSIRKMQAMWTGVRPAWLRHLMRERRISSSLRGLDVRLGLLSPEAVAGSTQGATVFCVVFRPRMCSLLLGAGVVFMALGISEPIPRVSLVKNVEQHR